MENQQQILIETQFEDLTLYVRPHETHEWLLTIKEIAEGYGVSIDAVYAHLKRNSKDFIENKHFIRIRQNVGFTEKDVLFFNKRGVIRLGFFIKSARAKLFRDWAEDLIIRELEKKEQYVTLEILQKVLSENNKQQDAKMHQYLDALNTKINKNHAEVMLLIHNLAARVDKLENPTLLPQKTEQKEASTYLMRRIGTHIHKFGKSVHPSKRRKELEVAGEDLELVDYFTLESEQQALLWENTFKTYFKDKRIKGEWFLLTEEDVAFFVAIARAFEKLR